MNKVQDGFFTFTDSIRPLTVCGSDRKRMVKISFVGEKILLSPMPGTHLEIEESSAAGITFKVAEGEPSAIRLSPGSLHAKPVLEKK